MKKIFVLHLLLTAGLTMNGQTNRQTDQLATLGKVWGFLKYYHPSAAKGQPDWDSALLRMIPLAEHAKSVKAFDLLLDEWFHSLPAAQLSATAVNWHTDSLERIFTETHIQQFKIAPSLKKELVRLYQYHLPDSSRYVTRYYNKHYFDHIIHTEDDHENPAYPDRSMRLLALFRYWNTIEYFYPHKNRIKNWDKVLTDYIGRFLTAKDEADYLNAVRELIHELPDSHSFLQGPVTASYYQPFRIDYIDGKYLIGECNDSASKKWDYRLGDEIIAINGKPVLEREKELLKTTTGTNKLSLHRNIAQDLLKVGDTILPVSFKRNGETILKHVRLYSLPTYRQLPRPPAKPLWEELERGIWYVRFCRITSADTLQTLFRDIQNARAVIWEMRDYPNYKVTLELNKYLFTGPTILTQERNASDHYPGAFIKSPLTFAPAAKESLVYTGLLIVLVDEHTQSLSESVSAALRLRPNTVTMGRQTAGTTGNITWLSLPGGLGVSYTGVGVNGSQQSFRQGDGVKVDVPIELTPEAISSSRDYMLQRALQHAKNISAK